MIQKRYFILSLLTKIFRAQDPSNIISMKLIAILSSGHKTQYTKHSTSLNKLHRRFLIELLNAANK